MLIAADRLFDGVGLRPGWVRIAGDTIAEVGDGAPPAPADLTAALLVPGYVDAHCHGGGGASFLTTEPAEVASAAATHLRHGTTTVVASLVTAAPAELESQVAALATATAAGTIAGIHLEGPWLAPGYRGAHAAALLAAPDPGVLARLLARAGGALRMVTVAPELPGALNLIGRVAAAGAVAAVGHTAADLATARAAITAGATGATHLFNAMPPLHHRAPGPVLALWTDPRVFLELIFDGVHLAPELAAFVLRSAPERAVLVTDAMAAAGAGDGDHRLGTLAVQVRDGVARVAGTDTIAGSTLTLDRAVRNAVAAGVDLAVALRAATANPAAYLGLAGVGRLAPGYRADLLHLGADLAVRAVMRAGRWVR